MNYDEKKNLLQNAGNNPILRGSKVPCLKPLNPMRDPKNPPQKTNIDIHFFKIYKKEEKKQVGGTWARGLFQSIPAARSAVRAA